MITVGDSPGQTDCRTETTPPRAGRRLRSRCIAAWPLALLAAATAIYHWDLIVAPADHLLAGHDVRSYLRWIHQFSRESLLDGRLPVWNPHVYGGVPFIANPQTTVFYPLSWFYLFMPVALAERWMIVTHTFLAGCFMYALLRQASLRKLPALIACLPWMFGSYFAARTAVGHMTLLFTATWIPLVFFCFERAIARGSFRWAFWTGVALGVQLMAGGDQNCYYTALALVVYGLARAFAAGFSGRARWDPRRYWPAFSRLGVAAAVAALTSAAQLLPTAELALNSDRATPDLQFAAAYSFPFSSLPAFLLPWSNSLHSVVFTHGPEINLNWELAGYIGILPLVLAGLGLFVRNRPVLSAMRVVLLLAAILMLGSSTPIYGWLYGRLPGLSFFRIPGRAVVLFDFALCVAAGFGLNWLLAKRHTRWRARRWRGVSAAGLIGALAVIVVPVALWPSKKPTAAAWADPTIPVTLLEPVIVNAVVILVAAIAFLAVCGRLNRPAVIAGLLLVLGADLFLARPNMTPAPPTAEESGVVERMREIREAVPPDGGPVRLDLSATRLSPNAAVGADVNNVNGYWPLAIGRFYRYAHFIRDVPIDPMGHHSLGDDHYWQPLTHLRILNVAATSQFSTTRPDGIEHRVVRCPDPLPRAWIVYRAEAVGNEREALARMGRDDFDPARAVILESDAPVHPPPTTRPDSTVSVRSPGAGRLDINVKTSEPGYLVISEIMYPGWRASIDGRPVELIRADSIIAALPVPAGEHAVAVWFESRSVRWGITISSLAVLAALLMLIHGYRYR